MYHPSALTLEQENAYCVKLPGFEGPFDLLYSLVTREKMDIRDIPIAHIVDQYMAYLSSMEKLQVNLAGDFLLMAASLLQLKSRLLLPRLNVSLAREDDAYFFGSKEDLVRSLLAYRRFKLLAMKLRHLERTRHGIFLRNLQEPPGRTNIKMQPSLFPYYPESLQNALWQLSEKKKTEKVRKLTLPEEVSFRSILHKIKNILKKMDGTGVYLDIFFKGWNKKELVVAFFAFLELARKGKLKLAQDNLFGRIRVSVLRYF